MWVETIDAGKYREQGSGWWRIRLPDGKESVAHEDELRPLAAIEQAAAALDYDVETIGRLRVMRIAG